MEDEMRKVITVIIISLFVISMHVKAEQLDKVGPALNYWYNFYFDPGWIEHVEDSINNMQPHQTIDGRDLLPPPKLAPGKPWLDISKAPIKYYNGVPHVKNFISYNGDGTELKSLGVLISPQFGNGVATVSFPLSILPDVLSLHTVQYISDRANAKLLNTQLTQKNMELRGRIQFRLNANSPSFNGHVRLMGFTSLGSSVGQVKEIRISNNDKHTYALDDIVPGVYYLIFHPSDNCNPSCSVSEIEVKPDSCTQVEITFKLNPENIEKLNYSKWQRTDEDVTPLKYNRDR